MSTITSEWVPDQAFVVGETSDPFHPYDHQIAAWDKLARYFHEDKRKAGILVVPTGGGKTAIAARWLLSNHIRQGGRVLWFAHRRSLLRQAFHTFAEAAHLASPKKQLRLITISSEDRPWSSVSADHDVVFSSMQSAVRESNIGFLELMRDRSPNGLFIVVDEAHHGAAPGYVKVLSTLKKLGCPLLGLTATPVRMNEDDEKRLWNVFEGIVYQIDKRTLFNHEILARPSTETVKTEINFERDFTEDDLKHLERYGELAPRVLARLAKHAGRNHLIVEHYLAHKEKFGPTIVFGADVLHAQTLAREFQDRGVKADYVDYSRKDAHEVMNAYRDGESMVLANVEMLTEGFDAPRTRTVFIARPTRSESLLAQMIGRALRGVKAGGNETAYLVTFLDTWEQFDPLGTEYVAGAQGDVGAPPPPSGLPGKLIPISAELVQEAYRLVQSNVRGSFTGLHQCLPYGWYLWEEEFENDVQRRLILVFENQKDGYAAFQAQFEDATMIPADVTENMARELVRQHFGDCPDPQPRWADLKAILDARRKGCEIAWYSFEEKRAFDPATIAASFYKQDLAPRAQQEELTRIWDHHAACQLVYRRDFQSFKEDVSRELLKVGDGPRRAPTPPAIAKILQTPLRAWPAGEAGYRLTQIRDAVIARPTHFPKGAPRIADIAYSTRKISLWGYFRYSDKRVCVNRALNSPDVPLYVVEFLVYHELLHADMPSAGHNRDFREREWRFTPSEEAVVDAKGRGIVPTQSKDAWRLLGDNFLDTFAQKFSDSGLPMEM